MRTILKIPFSLLIASLISCGPNAEERAAKEKAEQASLAEQEAMSKENWAKEELRNKEEERAAHEEKIRIDNIKKLKRHCMSKNEIDAFLWVKQNLFKLIVKKIDDKKAAKARVEVATAKAFGLEPANWAKRDIVEYVENERIWAVKKANIDKRYKEAHDYSEKIYWSLPNTYPGEFSGLYWSKEERQKNPNNPFSIAKENEIAIGHEREQLYHQFNRERPEEKVEELLGKLLLIGMMGI